MHPNILLATLVVNHSSTAFRHADNKVGEPFRGYHSESGLYNELNKGVSDIPLGEFVF